MSEIICVSNGKADPDGGTQSTQSAPSPVPTISSQMSPPTTSAPQTSTNGLAQLPVPTIETPKPILNSSQLQSKTEAKAMDQLVASFLHLPAPTIAKQTFAESAPALEMLSVKTSAQPMIDDEYYAMKSKPRGYCLIFNLINFPNHSTEFPYRFGSEGEGNRLTEVFSQLHFEVNVFTNFSKNDIENTVEEYSQKKELSKHDCFVLIVLSHGVNGGEFVDDRDYGVGCEVQALSENLDFDTSIADEGNDPKDTTEPKPPAKVPTVSDVMICYSTIDGHVSYRSPGTGSWLGMAISSVLLNMAHELELPILLTKISDHVSKKENIEDGGKRVGKQVVEYSIADMSTPLAQPSVPSLVTIISSQLSPPTTSVPQTSPNGLAQPPAPTTGTLQSMPNTKEALWEKTETEGTSKLLATYPQSTIEEDVAQPVSNEALLHVQSCPQPMIGPNYYAMESNPRGYCLIFNIIDFPEESIYEERVGSQSDAKRLYQVFQELHFKAKVFTNSYKKDIKLIVDKYSKKRQLLKHDCFVLIVLSHGKDGGVFVASDAKFIAYKDIIDKFNNKNCKNLINKPKLFFFSCCRGGNRDLDGGREGVEAFSDGLNLDSVTADTENDGMDATKPTKVPTVGDIMICYSTLEGKVSGRNRDSGTYLGMAISNVLVNHAHQLELSRLLPKICDYVSKINGKQVVEYIYRGFKKRFHFNPYYFATIDTRSEDYVMLGEQTRRQPIIGPEYYPISSKTRGYCLIFNIFDFPTLVDKYRREGSERDANQLKQDFQRLHFEVDVISNPIKKDIDSKLEEYSQKTELLQHDCFVLIVLSHGVKDHFIYKDDFGVVYATGGPVNDEDIDWVTSDVGPNAEIERILAQMPTLSDVMICYSTIDGFRNYRNEKNGIGFGTALSKVLRKCDPYIELTDLLIDVNM
ncbi:unnamed protein product [Medioppia subpectinata]|uniref:Uncharacterized protein n=1 Tax=Medioppia subpectinata TaxID=1979941 RepID=A0A7R9KG23_9ACAR|nr:unnamed protein product [Medioppia subpectinata]CAG2101910.1 unnamed protein product [Medioppia subpectinata]